MRGLFLGITKSAKRRKPIDATVGFAVFAIVALLFFAGCSAESEGYREPGAGKEASWQSGTLGGKSCPQVPAVYDLFIDGTKYIGDCFEIRGVFLEWRERGTASIYNGKDERLGVIELSIQNARDCPALSSPELTANDIVEITVRYDGLKWVVLGKDGYGNDFRMNSPHFSCTPPN